MAWLGALLILALIFFLFRIFPLQMIVLSGVLVVGGGMLGVYAYVDDRDYARQRAAITMAVAFNPKACSIEFPLLVAVHNSYKKPVGKVSWNFEARKPGYSNNLVNYGRGSDYDTPYSSDKILHKGQTDRLCYAVPVLNSGAQPENLVWSIGKKEHDFLSD